ncbi:MAG: HAMP domain-containing sensor histidine kinase [Clostridia bacterium]
MKSVFWKMFLILTGILLLSFAIMAGFFYIELDEFTYNRKMEYLDIIAGEIYLDIVNAPYDLTSVPGTYIELEARNDLAEVIRLHGENSNSIIWVVNEDGRIIALSEETEYDEKFFVRDFYNRTERYIYDGKYYTPYFKTNQTDFVATDVFSDIYEGGSTPPGLTYIKTYKLRGNDYLSEDSKIGIYIHTPREELVVARRDLLLAYFIPWVISLCAAAFLATIPARDFSRPLKGMMDTAREVAKGNFKARAGIGNRRDEIGELGRTFNKMLDQMENLEQSRQAFISDVSHELRTPITSVNGFVEGMLDGTIPQERHAHYLGIVKSETGRLNRLISDLMILARLADDGKPPVKVTFDLNEMIREVVISMEQEITAKGVRLSVDFEDDRTMVHANRDDIERVVVNLLGNAVKFTPGGKGIYISTKAVKTRITVGIRDEGCGIAPDKMDMIWDRFYKADSSRGLNKGGSGLGLAIVKNILAAHGESIHADSIEGEWTEFTFTLQQGV